MNVNQKYIVYKTTLENIYNFIQFNKSIIKR